MRPARCGQGVVDHPERGRPHALAVVETWGREKGAVVTVTDTNLSSPISVLLVGNPDGYQREAVILRETLKSG
ncbi:hypothetical protein GCM10010191_08290 [Actinomadura vinacea]|uniref:Uncharacterized protein n=1 Tax=Actinomadura vinacea TaxID=115336 RepID=A0ABN3IGY9_9ACTN